METENDAAQKVIAKDIVRTAVAVQLSPDERNRGMFMHRDYHGGVETLRQIEIDGKLSPHTHSAEP